MLAVRRSFDRAAASYRQSAEVQAEVAEKLAALLKIDACETALEIGCGDGLFTEKLVAKVAIDRLLTLDLARAPLLRMPSGLKAFPIQADAEMLPVKPASIDLLVSSSCLQWFNNPHQSLPRLLACLRPQGSFFFSVFCHGTFTEMEQINRQCGFGRVNPLPKEHELLDILQQTTDSHIVMATETVTKTYPDVMTFLHSQKGTGASYSGSRPTRGKHALQRFVRAYEEHFATDLGIPVSYRIAYFQGSYHPRSK